MMRVLQLNEGKYRVFGEELIVLDHLPTGVYTIAFSKMMGFSLNRRDDLEVREKLYGEHEAKIDKIIRSYGMSERSLGVIFSGDKGLGKSIAARLLCSKMEEKGFPIILVSEYIPGIIDFIESIKQECVILFDEFEKTFRSMDDGDVNPQEESLSLFDGTSNQKRLYVVTCNKASDLNDYLVNRPGRFHYHISWKYPAEEEVREYLVDHVEPEYQKEIDAVINFTRKSPLNYDCLRAIAFELNTGTTFKDAIPDLNIKNDKKECLISIFLKNGEAYSARYEVDFYRNSVSKYNFYGNDIYIGSLSFNPKDLVYLQTGKWALPLGKFSFTQRYEEEDKTDEVASCNVEFVPNNTFINI